MIMCNEKLEESKQWKYFINEIVYVYAMDQSNGNMQEQNFVKRR